MARGSIVKRCPVCRIKEGRRPGHVCASGEASYYIVYPLQKRRKWEFGGRTKKDAQRLLTQRLADIQNGSYREAEKILFTDFAQTWLENCPKPRVKESTFRGYQTDIRLHLDPAFKDFFIRNITQEDVQQFLSRLIQKKSRNIKACQKCLDPKTVNNIRLTLYMILDYARRLKHIPENPVADVKPFKVEHREMDYLNPGEIQALLKQAREPFRTVILAAILTGLRKGELLALQWGDVDWNSNTIFVRRSIYWKSRKDVPEDQKRWVLISPKTKRSSRAVFMSPQLKVALDIHRIQGAVGPYDFIFCGQSGEPLDPDHLVSREYKPALSAAGLREISFHALRHTYTSLLIAQGENVKFIQSQLGHASIQTTLDRYGHLLPVDQILVGNRLDEQVFGGSPSNASLTEKAGSARNVVNLERNQQPFLVDNIEHQGTAGDTL